VTVKPLYWAGPGRIGAVAPWGRNKYNTRNLVIMQVMWQCHQNKMYQVIIGWVLIRNWKTEHTLIAKPFEKWHLEEQVVDGSINRESYVSFM